MNKLVLTPHFTRAYKKFVRRSPLLKEKIDETLRLLEKNIYDSKLQTHKLFGVLVGCLACSADMIAGLFFNLIMLKTQTTE